MPDTTVGIPLRLTDQASAGLKTAADAVDQLRARTSSIWPGVTRASAPTAG
jgi:hypothetical protein